MAVEAGLETRKKVRQELGWAWREGGVVVGMDLFMGQRSNPDEHNHRRENL